VPYKLDFKQIAESVDIYAVVKLCELQLTKDRATCPVCDSERSIQLFAESNSFRCHSAELSGDCISLYAHINGVGMYPAAKALAEQFRIADASGKTATSPQKPGGVPPPSASTAAGTEAPKKGRPSPFDPAKFAQSLGYDERVKATGISEENAAKHRIGSKRDKLFVPICPPDVEPVAYAEIDREGNIRLPDEWFGSKVVPFKKRA